MAEINLLPTSSQPVASSKYAGLAKKIGTIGGVVLSLVIFGYAGVYGFYYFNQQFTVRSTEELETQIRSQETTEQKIILLRDRASKAAKIIAADSASSEANAFVTLNTKLPEGVVIKDTKLLPTEMRVSISAEESRQITEFIRAVKAEGKYSQIESLSLDFSPKDRYLGEFRFIVIPPQQ